MESYTHPSNTLKAILEKLKSPDSTKEEAIPQLQLCIFRVEQIEEMLLETNQRLNSLLNAEQ